jgi:hypothetical protein
MIFATQLQKEPTNRDKHRTYSERSQDTSHRLLFNADQESLQRKVQRPRRQADIRHHVTGLGALGLLGWRRKRKQAA